MTTKKIQNNVSSIRKVTTTHVISLGGSLIVPERVDIEFLKNFKMAIDSYMKKDEGRKLILICGGGATARDYQRSFKKLVTNPSSDSLDWIGIMATRLNAEIVRQLFREYTPSETVTNPTEVDIFVGRIMIAAGWKPGFSTDYDSVILAEKFSADTVINLSNIKKVYTEDPKKNPNAEAIDRITWKEFKKLVGEDWEPGINLPFDPVATKRAAEIGLRVIIAEGKNIPNLINILTGRDFIGTTIEP